MFSAKDIEELNAKKLSIPTAQCTRCMRQNNSKELLNAKSGQPKEHLPLVMRLLITSLTKNYYKIRKNFSHYSSKLKRQESELNSFCKRTGLLPDGSRSQVYGFGRSTAQKAVWKNKKQKVDAAANSAIRNTGKVLEFNSKTSFRINIDGYDQAIIDGLSSASKRVAELGSKDDLEHLILVDLSNGAHSYLEVGNHFSVGFKI